MDAGLMKGFVAGGGVHREVRDAHRCGLGNGSPHRRGDVVKLEIEKTLGARSVDRFDGGWTHCGIELQPDLEGAYVLVCLLDQRFGSLEVCNIERKGDARPWAVFIHDSPQQRYGAD
jgi:hypothetical protein